MVDIKQVADEAEVIIDGYAFSKFEGGYRVLNLNASDKAAVFAADGTVLETTMNDIELHIASKYSHGRRIRFLSLLLYPFKSLQPLIFQGFRRFFHFRCHAGNLHGFP